MDHPVYKVLSPADLALIVVYVKYDRRIEFGFSFLEHYFKTKRVRLLGQRTFLKDNTVL